MRTDSWNQQTGGSVQSQKNTTPETYAELLRENARLKEACEKARSTGVMFTHIALSLARGYTDLYYVNMDTDEFIDFHTDDEYGVLSEARRGSDFFEGCERDAKLYVHEEDQEAFVKAMNRQFLEEALGRSKVFELIYRRIKGGDPFYVRMRVSRMEDDARFIVLAVADIDEQMKQRRIEERMMEERVIYARLHAITGNFICVYVVNPETDSYREFSATDNYVESFAQAKDGQDFFGTVREAARTFNYPEDLNRFLAAFTKENMMAEVKRSGIFTLGYRLLMEGKPIHVQMKAAMVEEKEGPRLVVGINDIDAQVRQEEETGRRLAQAQTDAARDALTGIKNKYAYSAVEARMDREIEEGRQGPFAVVVLDVNDLKKVNDTAGHQAGDQFIRGACKIVCDTFKRSPVFRVGGDEFAVISQGHDYEHIDELLEQVSSHNAVASRSGGIVIACGMSKFDGDACVAKVFERADRNMYENKKALKSARSERSNIMFQFAHNNINVLDLERSMKFYEEALGLKEVRRINGEGFIIVYLGDAHQSRHLLELTWLKDRKEPYNLGDNEFHLAFTTDDFDAAHAKHKEMGCICYENPGMGIYFISDPDGYWLEVLPQ